MADNNDVAGICGCGRLRDRVHCPACGSYYCIAYARQGKTLIEHHYVRYKLYWCRHCGEHFNEMDWQHSCHAQPLKKNPDRRIRVDVHTEQEKEALEAYLYRIRSEQEPSE